MTETQDTAEQEETIRKWKRLVMIVHGLILVLAILAMCILIPMFGQMFVDF